MAYMFPCVRFAYLVRLNPFRTSISATHATLGMGGWLTLTQPGLSPGKKRQASLDARHGRTASRPAAPAQIPACGTTAPGSSVILVSHKKCPYRYSSLLFPALRFAHIFWLYNPVCVSFTSCVLLLVPFPCGRLSRPQSTMNQSDSLIPFSLPLWSIAKTYCKLYTV